MVIVKMVLHNDQNVKGGKSLKCGELLQGMNAQSEKIATCRHCKVTLCGHMGSDTSHLKHHLEDL